MTLGQFTYEVPFDSLWTKDSYGNCYFEVGSQADSEWTLGDVFIRNFYINIRYDDNLIVFYGHNIQDHTHFNFISGNVALGLHAAVS